MSPTTSPIPAPSPARWRARSSASPRSRCPRSMISSRPPDRPLDCAETHGAEIVRRLLAAGIPKNVLMNVNFPNCPAAGGRGRRDHHAGQAQQRHHEDRGPQGRPRQSLSLDHFQRGDFNAGAGHRSRWRSKKKKISITPLQLDFTDHPTVTRLAAAFEGENDAASGGAARPPPNSKSARRCC